MAHPTNSLNEVVHQRARLGVLAILAECRRADFGHLRKTLGLTDGNLSTHLQVLEGAGFVKVEKTFEGRRPRTWIAITKAGRQGLDDEIAALRAVINQVESGR